jgi:hypothetical protein
MGRVQALALVPEQALVLEQVPLIPIPPLLPAWAPLALVPALVTLQV